MTGRCYSLNGENHWIGLLMHFTKVMPGLIQKTAILVVIVICMPFAAYMN
jgi:hypothetical protein